MIADFRTQGFQILATGFTNQARSLVEWDLCRPTAFIFGNEHRGVSPELLERVPDHVYIPMQGMVQSLNVSVAAAITLFEAWRQRQLRGMFDRPSYPADELEALVDAWSKK